VKADLNQYKLKMLLYILRNHGFLITNGSGLSWAYNTLAWPVNKNKKIMAGKVLAAINTCS